jgi:hypothetical protein
MMKYGLAESSPLAFGEIVSKPVVMARGTHLERKVFLKTHSID